MKKITLIITLATLLVSCSKEELTRKMDSVKTMGENLTILENYRKQYPNCKF